MNGYKLKRTVYDLVSIVVLIFFLIVILIPIVWFIVVSIQPSNVIHSSTPVFHFTPTFKNYVNVFSRLDFLVFLKNSFIVCGSATILALIAGSLAAYSFARLKNSLTTHLSFWVLSTRMLPPIAVVIPLYLLLSKIGLLDTFSGLILVYITINLPYVVWMMKSFFEEIPPELDEAAMVDGCSKIGILRRIIIPIALPGVISTGVFVFILSWSEFLFALILTGTRTKTLPVAIAAFITDRGIEWGNMAAAGSALILPLAVMFYFIQKFLIRGLTFGALKG
jgi:multiple sugar transport system permease protein